jgi:thiol:disulfide interchange protein
MQLPSGGKILGFLGFVLIAAAWAIVHDLFGQTAGFRFWGAALLVIAVILTFRREISVSVGNTEKTTLCGWRKAYVLIPAYGIGAAVSLWPHQIACAVHLRGYVCV